MQVDHSYLIELDYGNRKQARKIIKDILSKYDRFSLTGSAVFVNNNPYHFELLWFVSFEKEHKSFENYLSTNYPNIKIAYNKFVSDLIASFPSKSYNSMSLNSPNDVDFILTSSTNDIFFIPDRDALFEIWGKPQTINNFTVFLSHSSKDKYIVDKVFSELQSSEIKAWYDKKEIIAGDSITNKINKGLQECDFGLIFLSDNFLNGESGWTESEANFFMQQRMRDKAKKFIILNIDVPHGSMPPLMQDYRYINISNDDYLEEIVRSIRHHQTHV